MSNTIERSEFGKDVEQFVEQYIQLMEAGNWEDFYRIAEDTFTQRSISRLNQLLIAAKIDPVTELEYIPDNFLRNAGLVTNYDIPNNCKKIGDKAFAHSGLQNITIPESVETLGADVFYNCYDLKECIFQTNKLSQLPDGTFDCCSNLKRLVIPKGVQKFNTDILGNVDRSQKLVIEFDGTAEEFRRIKVEGFYDVYFTVKCVDETFDVHTRYIVQV